MPKRTEVLVLLALELHLASLLHLLGLLFGNSLDLYWIAQLQLRVPPIFQEDGSLLLELIVAHVALLCTLHDLSESGNVFDRQFELPVTNPYFNVLRSLKQPLVKLANLLVILMLNLVVNIGSPDCFGHVHLVVGEGELEDLLRSLVFFEIVFKLCIFYPGDRVVREG